MLKFVYSLFLGLLLVFFIGVGISAFYPEPEYPKFRPGLITEKQSSAQTDAINAEIQKDQDEYTKKSLEYSRNVSIIVLVFAVALLVAGLALAKNVDVLANGMLLGGTFSLIYSIGRGFVSQDAKYTFVVVSIGLVVTMLVGYLKFIKVAKPVKSRKK